MPPVNAGAGHAPASGRGAPSAEALAAQARHKLARHLPADSTFRQELEQRLHLHPFRGIVTAVQRDSGGTNNVYVKRTGQAHADPNPYPVFASKLIPILNDEVLLEYIAGSPTAMVTQARKGGRPDELDVPYSGGSRRTYDSARALIRKHRDDHNSAHYRANGATVAHVTGENGDHQSIGDHYHSVGTLTESAGKSGGYQRHTRASGRYENRHHDGATERLAQHIEEVSGDVGFYANGTMHVNHTTSGNGGKTRHKQHGGSGFHETGDDGLGTYRALHASGQYVLTHNGTTLTMGVAGSTVLQHIGTLAQYYVGNKLFLSHDGSTARLKSNSAGAVLNDGIVHDGTTHSVFSNNSAVIQHQGNGAGGKMQVRDSSGGWHLTQESTTGHMEHISTGGEMHLKTGGVTGNRHLLDGNQHQLPMGTAVKSTDSSRVDCLAASGSGGLKAASHSTTTISNQVGGLAFPSGVNASGSMYTYGGASGGSDTGLLFKSQYVQVFDGGHANPGDYRAAHGAYGASTGPYGTGYYNGTGYDANHAWQVMSLHANGAVELYGTNLNSTSGVSCWATLVTVLVNT